MVLITATGTIEQAVQCMRLGASDYIDLALAPDALAAAVERAIRERHHYLARRNEEDALPVTMVGECLPMRRLLDQIDSVAASKSAVLIVGEPGSGKELIARAVHAASDRSAKPLITLNCAAVPAALIEDELFGSVDASGNQRLGLLQTADGGTLFLDDVAELPMEAQTRVLQLLNDGHIRPVGSTQRQAMDVRLLAATSRPMESLVANGQFREDLYYRLSVFTLGAPALRERGEDILRLADSFLQKTATNLNRPNLRFTTEAQDRMLSYHWPGNVRELVNAVERAVILCDGNQINASELAIADSTEPPKANDESNVDQTSLEDYFVKFVTEHQDQLTETELAERLGISRKSLWERRQRLNIPRKKTKKRGPWRESN